MKPSTFRGPDGTGATSVCDLAASGGLWCNENKSNCEIGCTIEGDPATGGKWCTNDDGGGGMVNPPIPLSGTALSQPPSIKPTTVDPAIDVNQQARIYLETIAGVVGAAAAVAMCLSKKCVLTFKSKRHISNKSDDTENTEETENTDIEANEDGILNKIVHDADRSDTSTISTMHFSMSSSAQSLVELNTNATTTTETTVDTTSTPAAQPPIDQFDRLETQSYRSFLTEVFKGKSMKSTTDKSADESALVKSNTNTEATVETTVDTAATPEQPPIEQFKQLETHSYRSFLTEVFKGKSMKSMTDKNVEENEGVGRVIGGDLV
jgi:hypothetical protein